MTQTVCERSSHARSQPGDRYAALDLGTNNCRLLVARPVTENGQLSLKVIDSFSRIVRLGEGLSTTGVLSDAAVERTIEALAQCRHKMEKHAIRRSRCVATEACRRAANRPEFLERAAREAGIHLDVITHEEEARLAFAGCASLIRPDTRRALVFDIGGGSTELMWAESGSQSQSSFIRNWASIACGVMNLSERFGTGIRDEREYDAMKRHVRNHLLPFDEQAGISQAGKQFPLQMLCTSGTVTTLAAIHLDLPRYNRARVDGVTLPADALRGAARTLLNMSLSERFGHPCVGPERADFIIAGCAIMEAILDLWPLPAITIADRGVREGILFSLIDAR